MFYLGRARTYLHFVPKVMGYMELTHADLTDALVDEIHQWIRLSWIRTALDVLTMVCLFSAVACIMADKSEKDEKKSG
ncbi:hypothetical protein EON64_05995 [archaeon]|nr:MAG: hypothetical protein EON64_05995 [archaeon]